jgi:Leucine-rich repeat (LRR) protein
MLFCFNNQLLALPALPVCKILSCFSNQLTALPALPVCQRLYCYDNQLTELPALPQCEILDCSNNKITVIPPLPHCPNPIIDNNPIVPVLSAELYRTNRAWWASPQQIQAKQQLKHQLTQQQKKQIQKTDPISLQQFKSPALGDDFAIYDDSTLSHLPFNGVRGLPVTRNLPLKQALQKYKTQLDPAQKARTKRDIAKYVSLLQMLQTYGLEELFGNQ